MVVVPGTSLPTIIEAGDPRLDPSIESSDYQASKAYWTMVDDITSGVDAMRARGELYLPRFVEERDKATDSQGASYDPYEMRRAKAPLTNIYDDVLKNLSSKPFARELDFKGTVPQMYKDLALDLDGQGNSFHVFGEQAFKQSLNHAIGWVLVDYSRALPRRDGQELSRAEETVQGLRPIWSFIPAPDMLAVYSDLENGMEIITHARIWEPRVILDGFQEAAAPRIRIMQREVLETDVAGKPTRWGKATFTVYEQVVASSVVLPAGVATKRADQKVWQLVDEGEYTVGYLPLVPIMFGERIARTYRVIPPLRNVAHMQIDEYQQESNVQNIMEMTCFPNLVFIGLERPKDGKTVVGPRQVYFIPPSDAGNGDCKVIEPQGPSIEKVVMKLKDTQTEMRDLGMQPLVQQNLTVITTGQVAVKANSAVQAWAIKFKDAMETAWSITADWLSQPGTKLKVDIHTDYNAGLDQGTGFEGVMKLRLNGDISRETAIACAKRYSLLPDNFDIDEDAKQLAEEQQGLEAEQPIDPRTGLPLQQAGNVVAISRNSAQNAQGANGSGRGALPSR